MNGVPDYTGYTQPGGYQQTRYNMPVMQYNYPQLQGNNNMNMAQTQSQGTGMQVLKGRPVSCSNEAEASMIDLDGSLHIFTDVANKKIYTKRCLLDGTAEFKTYVLQEDSGIQKPVQHDALDVHGDYVSRKEFDKVLSQINRRFDDMEEMLNESNSNDV